MVNYGIKLRMRVNIKKEKVEKTTEFVEKIKKIQKKVILRKSLKKIK